MIVGTGDFEYGCFPGNMMMYIIDLDHDITMFGRYYNFYSEFYNWVQFLDMNDNWPGAAAAGHGHKKPPKLFEGSDGLNNFVANYLIPWQDVIVGGWVKGL